MAVTSDIAPDEPGLLLEFHEVYDTDPDDLWQAVTSPERMARWMAAYRGDFRLGGSPTTVHVVVNPCGRSQAVTSPSQYTAPSVSSACQCPPRRKSPRYAAIHLASRSGGMTACHRPSVSVS